MCASEENIEHIRTKRNFHIFVKNIFCWFSEIEKVDDNYTSAVAMQPLLFCFEISSRFFGSCCSDQELVEPQSVSLSKKHAHSCGQLRKK